MEWSLMGRKEVELKSETHLSGLVSDFACERAQCSCSNGRTAHLVTTGSIGEWYLCPSYLIPMPGSASSPSTRHELPWWAQCSSFGHASLYLHAGFCPHSKIQPGSHDSLGNVPGKETNTFLYWAWTSSVTFVSFIPEKCRYCLTDEISSGLHLFFQ